MDVYLTVDAEVWPLVPGWPNKSLSADVDWQYMVNSFLWGRTENGTYGLPYIINELNSHGLKATFFIETLFAQAAGESFLRDAIRVILDGGHDTQLHLHTEWLGDIRNSLLPGKVRQYIKEYEEKEQTILVANGIETLLTCGAAKKPIAFRAGGYGANQATLRALSVNGIRYDSSYNPCYLASSCELGQEDGLVLQPLEIDGVIEMPVSCFFDYPGHLRHTQLCACSARELEASMTEAWHKGWKAFVLVLHSAELLKKLRLSNGVIKVVPDRVLIGRFKRLCKFLSDNNHMFKTRVFSEEPTICMPAKNISIPRSSMINTFGRVCGQVWGRLL